MTTMATTVANIRRILQDNPDEDYITAAIASTSATTTTVNDVGKWAKGQVWEFNDGGASGAELVLVRAVDASTSTPTIKRGHLNSTAVTHSDDCVVLKEPRFFYDEIAQATNTVLDIDLYNEGLYEIVEHQVTSSATTTSYNAPTSSCEEWLAVYQRIQSTDDPRLIRNYTRKPLNVDTSLWSNGKVFTVDDNFGVPGTAIYYVNCAHKLALSTLSTAQERIVQFLACAYLLDWSEPRRTSGPTNQGDRTVRPGQAAATATYYRQQAMRMIAKERSYLKALNPAQRVFVKV